MMKFSREVGNGLKNSLLDFGGDTGSPSGLV